MRRVKILGENFQAIPDFDFNGAKKFIKKPRRYCKHCRKGYTTYYLNTFSKINRICGECEFNPKVYAKYRKYSIDYKQGEQEDAQQD